LKFHLIFAIVWCLQRAQAALQAVNAVQTGSMTLGAVDPSGMTGPSPVLRVIVENLFYPVTLDVLHQVYTSSSLFYTVTLDVLHQVYTSCSLVL